MVKQALGLLTLLVPLQVFIGDTHGLNSREHQPAKLAAREANGRRRAGCVCCCLHSR